MPLEAPDVRHRVSFTAGVREFHEADPTGRSPFVADLDPDRLADPAAFARYVANLLAAPLEETPRPRGWVPATTLWWIEDGEFVGRVGIRHRLTPQLRLVGGHIGYDVRPSRRRQGYAGRMLLDALPVAAALDIDPALLTCDDTNIASRKVIEAAGGRLFEADGGKLRFWVPTRLR
ncbi:MAG: GNAT family N-acetyltransferase [Hamadaea sp.]|nr:GNAT family N-acetyltransferase [Hamadaea sp.]NUR52321.1 GNAT family N-acetyltransferase [Hamadaea sp.]NUT07690.1 GNAT family N-acetyltransferase [Hamadaea sp.]